MVTRKSNESQNIDTIEAGILSVEIVGYGTGQIEKVHRSLLVR